MARCFIESSHHPCFKKPSRSPFVGGAGMKPMDMRLYYLAGNVADPRANAVPAAGHKHETKRPLPRSEEIQKMDIKTYTLYAVIPGQMRILGPGAATPGPPLSQDHAPLNLPAAGKMECLFNAGG